MSKTETQSVALRLANELQEPIPGFPEPTSLEAAAAAELLRLDAKVQSLECAIKEWCEKTNWVRKTCKPRELGMHLADVLRARIEALDAENKALRGAVGKAILAMQLAQSTHGVMVLSDPPQESWKFNRTSDYLRDAIDTAMAAAKNGGAA